MTGYSAGFDGVRELCEWVFTQACSWRLRHRNYKCFRIGPVFIVTGINDRADTAAQNDIARYGTANLTGDAALRPALT